MMYTLADEPRTVDVYFISWDTKTCPYDYRSYNIVCVQRPVNKAGTFEPMTIKEAVSKDHLSGFQF